MGETPTEETQPTDQFMARVFSHTFEFSQGDGDNQEYLIEEVHRREPSWKVKNRKLVDEIAQGRFDPILFPTESGLPQRHRDQLPLYDSPGEAHQAIDTVRQMHLDNLVDILNGDEISPSRVAEIALGMIREDYYFLAIKNGRERSEKAIDGHYDPKQDKFLSYLFYYGTLNRTTGIDVFNGIMKDVSAYIQDHWQELDATLCPVLDYESVYDDQPGGLDDKQPVTYGELLRRTVAIFNADEAHQKEGLQIILDGSGLHAA